jgi:hypothetical protein
VTLSELLINGVLSASVRSSNCIHSLSELPQKNLAKSGAVESIRRFPNLRLCFKHADFDSGLLVCQINRVFSSVHSDSQKTDTNMTVNPAQITRHHMANQAAPAYSLIRKLCACGKASTAKQLAQHGKCAACALAAVRDAIMPGDFAKLQHMLGAVQQYPKCKWGWRNYFAAGSGQQHEAMQRLVAAGLAMPGHESETQAYFHATGLGCKAAGLDAAGIKRAMEGA